MLLDGKKIKSEILTELKKQTQGLPLSLAVIQIGDDDASNIYIKQKRLMCEEIGIEFKHYKLAPDIDESAVINLINELNENNTTGILLQLPIPKKFNANLLQNMIAPTKDVDGLNIYNIGALSSESAGLLPCTAKGIIEILKRYSISLAGKHAVVVGRSSLVGRPVAQLLLKENATVTICHSKTINLKTFTKEADILVVATGQPHLITEDMVKPGAIVIDVGINKTVAGIAGDVDFEQVKHKAKYITPVPGGIGPMTIAMLAQNIYEAYLLQTKTSK